MQPERTLFGLEAINGADFATAPDGHTASVAVSRKIKPADIRRQLVRQNYKCALTGRDLTPANASIDHIVPLSRGGSHAPDNIQILHRDVNAAKGTMMHEEFIALCREVASVADQKERQAGCQLPT
jgi:hypothetical protein